MAEHFLTKTQIELGQCLEAGDELAIEAYPALLDALTAHGGEETAHLFAEPLLSRGNDQVAPSVSWYTDIKGNATPFNRLDDAAQNALGQELTRRLAPLQAALGNEQTGSLIGSALHIPDMNDVWSVDGTPQIHRRLSQADFPVSLSNGGIKVRMSPQRLLQANTNVIESIGSNA